MDYDENIQPEQVDSEFSHTIPTEWKKPPSLRELKEDLEGAETSHRIQAGKIETWLDNLNVTGSARPPKRANASAIQPKLIRKQAEWRYAALSEPFLGSRKIFNISPVTWEDREAAMQNELVLNNQFNTKINKTAFIDEYVRAAVNEGTAIVRVGWDYQDEVVDVLKPVVELHEDESMIPLLQELAEFRDRSPSEYVQDVPEELQNALEHSEADGVPYRPEITAYQEVSEVRTVRNQPTLVVCDYRNVVIDPTCNGDADKAKFIVYKYETSLSDLEKAGIYHNLDKLDVEGSTTLGEANYATENTTDFNFKDRARKKMVAYEYWGYRDIDGTGIVEPIVATWIGNTLIRLERSPYPDGKLPFVIVPYLPVRQSIYGEPDGELIEENQKIIGAVTRAMVDILARSASGQRGTMKGALDVTNRRKFERGQHYEYNRDVHPDRAFYLHTFAEIPQSAQYVLNQQTMDAESLSGVKAYSGGLTGDSLGRTATGVRGALDAASKRELGILRRLADGIVQIGHKIISMNAIFLDEEEVVRITNEEFVRVRRDDLAGHFDLHLSISTAEEDNAKAQELAFMLQTGGNEMDHGMRKMIWADIARLRKMPDLAKKLEEYEPAPDPINQRIHELTVLKLEMEIAEIESRIIKNQSDAGLNSARSGTEIARARNIHSDTDNKDLSYVEQETGVSHLRDIERQGAQARANQELESHKHRLRQEQTLLEAYIQNLETRQ